MNAPLSPKQIVYWQLARLNRYPSNAKTHDADQVAKIAASTPIWSPPNALGGAASRWNWTPAIATWLCGDGNGDGAEYQERG